MKSIHQYWGGGGERLAESFGIDKVVFQQDLTPVTHPRILSHCLDWPENTPDLCPVDNVWAIVKKMDCTTKEKMICAVIEVRLHDQEVKETCKQFIDAMPIRIEMIITEQGGHINY